MRMPTDQDYTIAELASIAGVTPRTVRYYISLGLLPPPEQGGPGTRYGEGHLQRVRLIRRLQDAHLPLAEIRRQIESMDDDAVASALTDPSTGPQESALDYIQALRAGSTRPSTSRMLQEAPAAYVNPSPAPALALPPDAETTPGPVRSQWERVALTPDVELHIRRPLARSDQKRIDRLITIARELLQEDQS
jgi:DNA-binding transcriptional MerR regulator